MTLWQEPIGPDPAHEEKDNHRQRAGREHEADVGLRSRNVQGGEDERDRCDCIAETRRGAPEKEEPKLPRPQRLEAGLQAATPIRLRL